MQLYIVYLSCMYIYKCIYIYVAGYFFVVVVFCVLCVCGCSYINYNPYTKILAFTCSSLCMWVCYIMWCVFCVGFQRRNIKTQNSRIAAFSGFFSVLFSLALCRVVYVVDVVFVEVGRGVGREGQGGGSRDCEERYVDVSRF